MTLQETGIIMDILTMAYPAFYNRPGAPDRIQTLSLWAEMFRDWEVAVVAAAVKSHIATDVKGYPPHIGAIMDAIHSLAQTGGLDADQAWERVRKAASRSGYGAREEFDRLPENLRRMVGSPSQLYEWSQMDSEIFNSVVASNFKKAYRVRQESDRRDALLPADVKKAISGLAGQLAREAETRKFLNGNLSAACFSVPYSVCIIPVGETVNAGIRGRSGTVKLADLKIGLEAIEELP